MDTNQSIDWTDPARQARLDVALAAMVGTAEPRVIFVCGGNICRSPYMEMRFEQVLQAEGCTGRVLVSSGGFIKNPLIHEFTKQALEEAGVPEARVQQFSPRPLRAYREEIDAADLVLIPARDVAETLLPKRYWEKTFLLSEVAGELEDVEDPVLKQDYETYKAIISRLDPYLDLLGRRLKEIGLCD
jgi:protein-tyrosine-phosphatase